MTIAGRIPRLLPLAVAAACAQNPAVVTTSTAAGVSALTIRVFADRLSLDSAVMRLQRAIGDTSGSGVARARPLKEKVASLDSSYRVSRGELQRAVNASIAGVPTNSARFPLQVTAAPFVRAFADGANWMLQSPFIHEMGKDGRYTIIVPRGFVTDFASIPQAVQVLRGVRPTTEGYGVAALVHDYLYWRQDCTREQSDRIMEISMREAGVSLLERTLIYQAVRQFGQSAWDGNRRARQVGFIRTVAPPNDQVPPTGTWNEYREWLRATRAQQGIEYRVHESVCAMADPEDWERKQKGHAVPAKAMTTA